MVIIFFERNSWYSLFYFLSLSPDMKRLAYITAMFLSLLIIYSGAGVSIVHYCCAGCETVQSCCATAVPNVRNLIRAIQRKIDKTKGCTATIYKLNLMNHATELTVAAPVVDLFCEQFCYLLNIGYTEKPVEYIIPSSPPPICSRQMLALYSTYII